MRSSASDFAWISDVLAEECQQGIFRHTANLADGTEMVYRTSWATGMGRLWFRRKYENAFGEPPPRWIEELHPYHQFSLFSGAINHGAKLPAERPMR